MASKKSSAGPIAPAPDAQQATAQLRAQLKAYTGLITQINSTLRDANQIHSELDVDNKPLPLVAKRLNSVWETIGEQTADEIKKVDAALESLDRLERLISSQPVVTAPSEPVVHPLIPAAASAPTPPAAASGVGTGNKRGPYKKRKNNDGSAAPSPAASAAPSPASIPIPSPSTTTISLPRIPKSTSQVIPPVNQPSPANSSASSSAAPTAPAGGERRKPTTNQNRKVALAGQLPLAPGRQVAFRQPTKGGGHSDPKKEEWILARVVTCIQGDKNRYSVEDVDPEAAAASEGGKYNTTLKSIVPLPDPRDRERTYPSQDFPPGTQVMALYPETTSFYRAVIISGPESEKGKKKEKLYKVQFDDDEDRIQPVPMELVVELP